MKSGVSRWLVSAALATIAATPGIALANTPSYDELLNDMSVSELEALHTEVFDRLQEAWADDSQKPREILSIPLEDGSVVFSIEEDGDALSYRFTVNDTSQLLDALSYFGFVEASTEKGDAEPCENVLFALDTPESVSQAYADGTYTGSAKGMESTIKVIVTVKDGKVAEVRAEGQETEGIGSKALDRLPGLIVEANGTEGVDGVSGATVTSTAILTATEEALENAVAGKGAAASDEDDASSSAAVDGASPAAEPTDATDESDATADADGSDTSLAYADGVYEGIGKGIGGDVPVTVRVEGGRIVEVVVGDNSETQGIGSKAIEQLPELIVEANGTEGVDAISGATVTSKAIFSAVEEALARAVG